MWFAIENLYVSCGSMMRGRSSFEPHVTRRTEEWAPHSGAFFKQAAVNSNLQGSYFGRNATRNNCVWNLAGRRKNQTPLMRQSIRKTARIARMAFR